jgi:serine/threonine protein kinase
MGCGTLYDRLEAHQIRGQDGGKVKEVTATAPKYLIRRWLMELCNADAWLESLGYVHGDIRPPNLLLDSQEHLKLADFDYVAPIGTAAELNCPPWARVLGDEAGDRKNTCHGHRS